MMGLTRQMPLLRAIRADLGGASSPGLCIRGAARRVARPVIGALRSPGADGLDQCAVPSCWGSIAIGIPLSRYSALFTAIYAFFFLGEGLVRSSGLRCRVVAGAVLISFRPGRTSIRSILLGRAFVLLMLGSAIHGSAHIFGKVAVDELPVLFTHALRSLGLGGVFLAFNLRSGSVDDVRTFVRTRSPALRFVAVNELVIATVGLLLLLWALALGPAALVTALSGARAFFLVVYSTALALVWKGALGEVTTPGVIAVKLLSTGLIVAGVAAIALGSA